MKVRSESIRIIWPRDLYSFLYEQREFIFHVTSDNHHGTVDRDDHRNVDDVLMPRRRLWLAPSDR